jgi:chemosensory pili system protein ChpA (sensor histidine kinase/response regulator)
MTTAPHVLGNGPPRSRIRRNHRPPPAPRALVLARNETFHRWAGKQLRNNEFQVRATRDGLEASAAADSNPPDLIVVDHQTPRFDVLCLLAQVKGDTRTDDIPILLVAPRISDSLRNACRTMGIAVLIRRPGEPTAVLHMPKRQAA